ncbi:hyaluronan synthase, partial [Podila clonocystis]
MAPPPHDRKNSFHQPTSPTATRLMEPSRESKHKDRYLNIQDHHVPEHAENPHIQGHYEPHAVPIGEVFTSTASTVQNYGLKSSYVSLWKKSAWIAFTLGIFLLPYIILKACFHVQVSAGAWQTSVTYGMLMAVDFMAVISFSALNRRRINTRVKKRDPHWVGLSTGILAVGYREDPILLEGCLKSLRAMRYQRNQRVMLVVDGNEAQDEYMGQIFLKVFEKQGGTIIRADFLSMDRERTDKDREELVRQIAYHPGPVCVMQPHRGKRSAMYTGFAALLQQGIESVVVTDSDTYLDPHVCK